MCPMEPEGLRSVTYWYVGGRRAEIGPATSPVSLQEALRCRKPGSLRSRRATFTGSFEKHSP
jgi:hypothetical protein